MVDKESAGGERKVQEASCCRCLCTGCRHLCAHFERTSTRLWNASMSRRLHKGIDRVLTLGLRLLAVADRFGLKPLQLVERL